VKPGAIRIATAPVSAGIRRTSQLKDDSIPGMAIRTVEKNGHAQVADIDQLDTAALIVAGYAVISKGIGMPDFSPDASNSPQNEMEPEYGNRSKRHPRQATERSDCFGWPEWTAVGAEQSERRHPVETTTIRSLRKCPESSGSRDAFFKEIIWKLISSCWTTSPTT